jgi:hypothetical protein
MSRTIELILMAIGGYFVISFTGALLLISYFERWNIIRTFISWFKK